MIDTSTFKPTTEVKVRNTKTGKPVLLPVTWAWFQAIEKNPKTKGKFELWEQPKVAAILPEAESQSLPTPKKKAVVTPVEVKKEVSEIDTNPVVATLTSKETITAEMVNECNDVEQLKAWGKQVAAPIGNTKSLAAIKAKIIEKL